MWYVILISTVISIGGNQPAVVQGQMLTQPYSSGRECNDAIERAMHGMTRNERFANGTDRVFCARQMEVDR